MSFDQVFETVDAGLLILDNEFKVTQWNRWMEFHSGISKDDIVGKSLFDHYPNLDTNWFVRSCKTVLHFGSFAFFSQKLHKYCFPFKNPSGSKDGFEFMQQECQVGPIRNANGKVDGLFIMVNDVTDITIYEKSILTMANRDGLTGLFIRRYFDEQMKDELSRFTRYGRTFSLLLIDLDMFKVVNDVHGHLFGDFVLKKASSLIEKNTRAVDTAARYGGEEFAVILPETDIGQAEEKAEFLRKAIEETEFQKGGTTSYLTASFGVSSGSKGDTSPEQIIARADKALYEAKAAGRNKVRVNIPQDGDRS